MTTTAASIDEKKVLKKHGITEKQAALIRMVAKHPIHGVNVREFTRVAPAAERHGVIEKVWLDKSPPIRRVAHDIIPGTDIKTNSNVWYELTERAVECMQELDPTWTYNRPSDRWKTK